MTSVLVRIGILCVALATVFLAAPSSVSPVEPAAANCVITLDDGSCTNPCMLAFTPYEVAREAAGLEDETPDVVCPM